MAESDLPTPMTDDDIVPPPATAAFEPASALKDTGVEFEPDDAKPTAATPEAAAGEGSVAGNAVAQAGQTVNDHFSGFGQQAADRARQFAEDGKQRVGGLLDQLAQMLTDAAGQVDDRLGAHYGDHARTAASSVQGFAQTVRDKDVDQVADDIRGYIRQSPTAALGIAAALGFALSRVVHAGLDQRH